MIEATEMTDEQYFAADGLSKSLLAGMDCPDKIGMFKSTPAMLMGTLAHCAILEPNEFDKRYIVDPKMPKRSNADKEAWQIWQDENAGKVIITDEQRDTSMMMQDAIFNHPKAASLLSGGKAEQAYFWTDEETGEPCKGKADYVQGDVIVDLKTAVSASPSEFSRAVANFKYHWQDAFYSEGTGAEAFYFVVIEKTEPFVIEVYELSQAAKDKGRKEIHEAKNKYLFHRDFEPYIGYTGSGAITTLDLPKWA